MLQNYIHSIPSIHHLETFCEFQLTQQEDAKLYENRKKKPLPFLFLKLLFTAASVLGGFMSVLYV